MDFRARNSTRGSSNHAVTKQETSMSKLIKVAVILAVAAVAIAAKQLTSSEVDTSAEAKLAVPAASVAPMEMMRKVGQLPETEVDSHF
jgi:hypothetical protein